MVTFKPITALLADRTFRLFCCGTGTNRPTQPGANRLTGLPTVSAADLANTVPTRPPAKRQKAYFAATLGFRLHDGKSREGVFARVSNHVFHTVEAVDPARWPGDRRNVARNASDHLFKSRGVGSGPAAARIIDFLNLFRGPFQNSVAFRSQNFLRVRPSKIWRRPVLKSWVACELGRADSQAFQDSPNYLGRSLWADRSQNTPAAVSESWRGMSS